MNWKNITTIIILLFFGYVNADVVFDNNLLRISILIISTIFLLYISSKSWERKQK